MLSKLETLIQTPTKGLRNWLRRWEVQIANALMTGQGVTVTPEGVVLFDDKRLIGQFFHRVPQRERDFAFDRNLVVDQGIMKALAVMFHTDTKIANWYVSMFNGAATPTNALTAANVAATMSEITSLTEGFSNATRPAWTPSAPAANVISSSASKAVFNIVATTSITATGAFIVSSDTRGGTSGTLWSAARFDAERELFNGETFELGYQTSLTT
jgi:hypothetical protein